MASTDSRNSSSAATDETAAPGPRRGSLLAIFLTVFIDLLGFGIVLPLLPVYGRQLASDYQFTAQQIGWTVGALMSCFSLMQFLFMPIWGRASDRYGRRPILLIGLVGSTFFYGMFGVATSMKSLVGLFVARIGAGIAGATIATAQAYIADTTTNQNRAKGMALIGAAFALGFTLGPSLGVVALLMGGDVALSPWPGYFASALSAVALAVAALKLPESLSPSAPAADEQRRVFDFGALRNALATPSVGLLLVTSFIAVFSFANFESTLSLQLEKLVQAYPTAEAKSSILGWILSKAEGWGYREHDEVKLIVIFFVFAYLGLTLTVAQGFLVRRLAGRMNEAAMALMGGGVALVGFVLLASAANSGNFTLLMVAMAIEVTGFAFVNPSLQSLISRRSHPDQQGGILGLAQSFSSLSRILGPVIGTRLLFSQPAAPYYAAAALMALGLVMTVIAARRGRDYSADAK